MDRARNQHWQARTVVYKVYIIVWDLCRSRVSKSRRHAQSLQLCTVKGRSFLKHKIKWRSKGKNGDYIVFLCQKQTKRCQEHKDRKKKKKKRGEHKLTASESRRPEAVRILTKLLTCFIMSLWRSRLLLPDDEPFSEIGNVSPPNRSTPSSSPSAKRCQCSLQSQRVPL
jgi:hypothetical protein